jgi:hypothetical protein
MKGIAGNVALDVTKKIFVRGDAEAGRSALPFDFESASRIDVGKRAYLAFICLDMTVAPNSNPVTCAGPHEACRQENNRNLLHGNIISPVTML